MDNVGRLLEDYWYKNLVSGGMKGEEKNMDSKSLKNSVQNIHGRP